MWLSSIDVKKITDVRISKQWIMVQLESFAWNPNEETFEFIEWGDGRAIFGPLSSIVAVRMVKENK